MGESFFYKHVVYYTRSTKQPQIRNGNGIRWEFILQKTKVLCQPRPKLQGILETSAGYNHIGTENHLLSGSPSNYQITNNIFFCCLPGSSRLGPKVKSGPTRVAHLVLVGESPSEDFLHAQELELETLLKRYQATYHLDQPPLIQIIVLLEQSRIPT